MGTLVVVTRVITWGADLRRSIWCAVGLAVGITLLLLFASTGLMHHETTRDPILADPMWAGILIGVGSTGWAYLQISTTRRDTGFRRDRLPSLLAVAVVASTAIYLALMCTWPLIIGDRAAPDSVIATLLSDPRSFGLVASFILALQCFATCTVLGLVRLRIPVVLVAVLGLLVLLGVGAWQGVSILENPASTRPLAVWAGLAVVGYGAMVLTAARLGPGVTSTSKT